MNITDMNKQDSAEVISFKNLNKDFIRRLMDLGIYQNATITLLNTLSFNRLYLIEVDNVEICIRREDAKQIEVKK